MRIVRGIAPWIFVLILSLFSLRLYQTHDAAAYYLEGLVVAKGGRPFLDIVEDKNPGIVYLMAVSAAFSGFQMWGAVILFALMAFGTTAIVHRLDNTGDLKSPKSYWAAMFFAASYFAVLAAGAPYKDYPSFMLTETPQAFFTALAIYFASIRGEPLRAGLCCGGAFLCRQMGVVSLIPVTIAFLDGNSLKKSLGGVYKLALGAALPVLAIGLVASVQGWLEAWFYYAFSWHAHEARYLGSPLEALISRLLSFLTLSCAAPIFSLFVIAFAARLAAKHGRPERLNAIYLTWFVVEAIFSSFPAARFVHYIIPSLAPLALIASAELRNLGLNESFSPKFRNLYLNVFCVAVLIFLSALPMRLGLFNSNLSAPNPAVADIARWIGGHSKDSDRILVWGFGSEIYLASNRLPASRHHYNIIVTSRGGAFPAPDERAISEFQKDMAATPPKIVVIKDTFPIDAFLPGFHGQYTLQYSPPGRPDWAGYVRKSD